MDEVLKQFVSSSDKLLELNYNDSLFNKVHYEMFNNVLTAKNISRRIEEQEIHIIDEEHKDNLMIVKGLTAIKEYIDGNPENIKGYKLNIDIDRDIIDQYELPFNIRLYSMDMDDNFSLNEDNLKIFSLLKRVTYYDNDCDYIAEVTKVGLQQAKTFRESKASISNYQYIFKVIIKNKDTNIDNVLRLMEFALNGNIRPIIISKQHEIINDYTAKTSHMLSDRIKNIVKDTILITPKPITLERMNVGNPDNLGAVSVIKNYAVTDKADGERFLLFFDGEGEGYLINNVKNVRGTGLKNKDLKDSLFDGELILCNNRKDDSNTDIFAIFDIYMLKGESTKDLPLIPDRYELMKDAGRLMNKSNTHEFIIKEQLFPEENETIFEKCNDILNNHSNLKYAIDGLIFTPLKLPVFGYYANKPVAISSNMKWDRVFKWKPPEQNTIEFIIKETGIYNTYGDGNRYKEFILYVGFNIENNEMIDVITGLTRRYDNKYKPRDRDSIYELREFILDGKVQKAHIPVDENSGNCYTSDTNEIILNNSVVEFSYNTHNVTLSNERRWIANRIRHDKNRIYNYGKGTITKTANDWDVAMNIWRSISKPVTINMITGVEKINFLESDADVELTSDDKYYNRFNDKDSSKLISSKMIMFHNRVIKPMLFKYPKQIGNNRGKLLELACGQGSDMDRWIAARYKFIFGVDYVKDNIENPTSGIYKRLITKHQKVQNKYFFPHMVFVIGDCKYRLDNGEAAKGLDKNSEDILKIILGKKGFIPKKYSQLNVIKDNQNTKFDVVSCMFSIHYFFEDEKSLDGFLSNIMNNLKEDGTFICTFMDGKTVEEKLNAKNGVLLGVDSISDAVVWAVRRNYSVNQRNPYGKKISVYIENSGKLIAENLVNFSLLESKCKQFGLTLVLSEMFEVTFNKTLNKENNMIKIDEFIINNLKELNEDNNLKEFSFFNRWAIFKRES